MPVADDERLPAGIATLTLELASLIRNHARYHGDCTALVCDGQRLSYTTFWSRIARVGNLLRALGIGPGDKVATVSGNSLALIESYWAVPTIGAVLVPLSPLLMSSANASLT